MDIITGNVGWIEVICGPMFSGKSEELIRRLRRAMIARKRVEVFKPSIDKRYSDDEIVSHGDLRMKSQVVANSAEIAERIASSRIEASTVAVSVTPAVRRSATVRAAGVHTPPGTYFASIETISACNATR